MSGVFETTFLQDQTALPFAHTHCLHASSVFFPANWIPKKISQSHFQCNSQIVFWKFSPHESQQNHNYVGNPHQVILRHSLAPVNTLTLLSVLLSLLVLLALSLSLSLSLSLLYSLFSLQNCQPLSSHSIILFIDWGGWRCYDYLLISLMWVGSNLILPDKNMLYWEWW